MHQHRESCLPPQHLIRILLTILRSRVINALGRIGNEEGSEEYDTVVSEFDKETFLFEGLDTRCSLDEFIHAHLDIVKPQKIFLGFRHDVHTDRQSGQTRQVLVPETFQYVSVLSTLGMILGNRSARHEIEVGHVSNDGILRDYCDSDHCKTHP